MMVAGSIGPPGGDMVSGRLIGATIRADQCWIV